MLPIPFTLIYIIKGRLSILLLINITLNYCFFYLGAISYGMSKCSVGKRKPDVTSLKTSDSNLKPLYLPMFFCSMVFMSNSVLYYTCNNQ